MGHASNTITRIPESLKGLEKLELLVVADPHPTTWAVLSASARTTPTCCRSAPSSRCAGSRTASNRSLQWGEQIVKPIFESKDDYEVMYLLAKKLGFADQMFKNIKVENNRAGGRGHPARDQPRQLVDRLLRPVAGAPQGAHGEPEELRPGHAAGDRRARQGRLLRPAVAVLGHAGGQASRHATALQHQSARHGRRRHLPRALRRRARREAADGTSARTTCWPRAPIRSAPRSRTAIPSSPMACSRSSAGTRI